MLCDVFRYQPKIFNTYVINFSLKYITNLINKFNRMSAAGNLKEEIVGHSTLVVMSVLGLALYSLTYSLVYVGSSSTPVVAVLEMWMVTTHLSSSIACCAVQSITATIVNSKVPLRHVAEGQCSLFLGIACIVTVLGNQCIQIGGGVHCSAYYGAAALPKLAAAGSIAWAWVMYFSSLGCQTWNSGISLGVSSRGSLTIASIVLLVPYNIAQKLASTCGETKWGLPLCNSLSCDAQSYSIATICLSLFFSHAGSFLYVKYKMIGWTFIMIGSLIMLAGSFLLWIQYQNNSNVSTVGGGGYHIVVICFSLISFLSGIWSFPSRHKNKKNNKNNGYTRLFSSDDNDSSNNNKTAMISKTQLIFPTISNTTTTTNSSNNISSKQHT